MDIVVKGKRINEGCIVVIKNNNIAVPLDAHNDLANHSSDGFEWGYSGSGPTQLAFAILFEYAKTKFTEEVEAYKYARTHYISFRDDFIASIKSSELEISFAEIERWFVYKSYQDPKE